MRAIRLSMPPLISLIFRHLPVLHFSPPQSSTVFPSPHSGSNERHRSTLLTAIAAGLPSLSPLLGLIAPSNCATMDLNHGGKERLLKHTKLPKQSPWKRGRDEVASAHLSYFSPFARSPLLASSVLNRFPLFSLRLKRTPPFYSPHCHRCRTAVAFPSTRSYRPPLISLISRHLPVLHFSPPQSSTVFPSSHSGSNERHRSTLLTAIAAGLPSLSPLLGLIGSKRKVTMNTIHETFKDYKYVNLDLDITTKRAALRASASVVSLIE
ncbi:hypothetical protein LguiA_013567 [Lonicera macranthoides]